MMGNKTDLMEGSEIMKDAERQGPPATSTSQVRPDRLFDGDDALFKSLIGQATTYFEYGCGASTRYAFEHSHARIRAVDSSKAWADRTQALAAPGDPRLSVKWVDVGPVADYGQPISYSHRKNFPEYADWFWGLGENPDLVLIDGRFRVCCFLTSARRARPGTFILFDDYTDRPQYHLVEEFLPVVSRCGRQALFIVTDTPRATITDELVAAFRYVMD